MIVSKATAKLLFQPRHPAFWLLLVINTASSMLVWILQHRSLPIWGVMIVLLLSLGNLWWSWRLTQQLLRTPSRYTSK